MSAKFKNYINYFINLVCPAFVFGSITGVLTALVITSYKVCAGIVIGVSESGYSFLRTNPYWIALVIVGFIGLSILLSFLYKKVPNLKGGGIPTSIGILRGVLPFKWFTHTVGVFFLSLLSFLIGVPLGNEGPSVQMGTLLGGASVSPLLKKHRVWSRYSMTGGSCAGFSVATGAPVSGIVFALEEAHQSFSPMIMIVASTSVMFAHITTEILSLFFNINTRLFHEIALPEVKISHIWIPVIVGIVVGVLAVIILKYYKFISFVVNKKLSSVPHKYKIFAVYVLTLIAGLCSFSFVSTGHHLIDELMVSSPAFVMLVAILLIRTTLTFSANSCGITGGLFLPIMAIGATVAALTGKGLVTLGVSEEFYTFIVVLGISACISGMMKTPFTAMVFAIEALSCSGYILPVIVATCISYVITEMFGVQSITDIALDNTVENYYHGKECKVYDTFVEVELNSFAVGKQIRDILWPSNLFVLSVKREDSDAEVDVHGGKQLKSGDILHIRYSTYDEPATKEELLSIVGSQDFDEHIDNVI
ncbi:MAG: chloride channel protein [Ruminococcus sp.]|nr:chloride channel protein [Ruminococcus sp.]MBQ8571924.1 chloride channel protein [Ruminococcus sp.]